MQISEITFRDGLLRRILLFQSLKQFVSYLAVVLLVVLLASLVVEIKVKYIVLAFVCSVPSLIFSQQTIFSVYSYNQQNAMFKIKSAIESMNCELVRETNNHFEFTAKRIPKIFLWDEQAIKVNTFEDRIEVVAPMTSNKRVRARLL